MKKSVIHNLNYAAPYPGNLMASIFALETKLLKNDIKLIYIFPKNAENLPWVREMQLRGKSIYFKEKSLIQIISLFYKIVKKHNVIIIHTHFWNIPDLLAINLVKIKFRRLKSIIHHHNHYIPSQSKLREYIKRLIISADANFSCSSDVAINLQKFKFRNVCTVENSIDFSRLQLNLVKDRPELHNCFLLFGFDFDRKGVDIALEAFSRLTFSNIKLAIVFAANEDRGIDEIKQRFGSIPDWIKILPPTENIAEYYLNCRAFISASREEGFCYSIIEAAYCFCESIISDIPGHRKDVPEIKIFQVNDTRGLERCILELIMETKEERERINLVQKKYVMDHYGLQQWVNIILEEYKSISEI